MRAPVCLPETCQKGPATKANSAPLPALGKTSALRRRLRQPGDVLDRQVLVRLF